MQLLSSIGEGAVNSVEVIATSICIGDDAVNSVLEIVISRIGNGAVISV